MAPPSRFTYHHHAATGAWYVYDRLLDRTVRIERLGVTAATVARDEEVDWRERCARWIEAEYRDSTS